MKRFRLSTLMLLIVIAGLCVALMVQHNRSSQREAELQIRLHKAEQEADVVVERAAVKEGDSK